MKAFSTCCLTVFLTASTSFAQDGSWNRNQILSTGTTRLADLVRTMGPISTATLDGHGVIFGDGSDLARIASPRVLVDGLEESYSFLGIDRLTSYSMVATDLDSIRWEPGIRILPSGRLADGVVHLRTFRRPGFSIRGGISAVNPTGDPGPDAYRGSSRANVDRSGPIWNLRMSWSGSGWALEAGFLRDEHHLTDVRILDRISSSYAGFRRPFRQVESGFARASFEGRRFKTDIRGGKTNVENFLFSETIGREWPVDQDWIWALTNSRFDLGKGHGLNLHTRGELLETANRSSRIPLPKDMTGRRGSAMLGWTWSSMEYRLNASLGGRISELNQAGVFDTGTDLTAVARAGAQFPAGKARVKLDGFLAEDRSSSLPRTGSASVEITGPVGERGTATVRSSWTREHPDLWDHAAGSVLNGGSYEELGPAYPRVGNLPPMESAEIMLSFAVPVSADHRISFGGALRSLHNLALPAASPAYDAQHDTFLPDSVLVPGQAGSLLSVFAMADASLGSTLGVQATWKTESVRTSDTLFQTAYPERPVHRAAINAFYEPVPRLRLHMVTEWRSAREYPRYPDQRLTKLAGSFRVNLTVQKDFWEDVMTAGITLLNLFDTPIQTHPAGVDEQLALRFHIRISFSDR